MVESNREEEFSWVDGFKISAEESAVSEQAFDEKANALVVAKNGVRFKKTTMEYACLESGVHGKEDATVRLFCNEKGVDMQVRVAACQFMIFGKDSELADMEYAEALADLHLSNMAAEDMITRIGTRKTEAEASTMESIMEEEIGSNNQAESMQVDETARGCCGFDWLENDNLDPITGCNMGGQASSNTVEARLMHAVGSELHSNVNHSDLVGAAKVQIDEESIHVHVECKHGFALISGICDATLQPACFEEKFKKQGDRWLQRQGLMASDEV